MSSLLSTRQRETEQLMKEWCDASVENQCPQNAHEYCAPSERGQPRKLNTVRTKQNRSTNKRADRTSKHNTGFEYKYDLRYMQEESHTIAQYTSAEAMKPKRRKKRKLRDKDRARKK